MELGFHSCQISMFVVCYFVYFSCSHTEVKYPFNNSTNLFLNH